MSKLALALFAAVTLAAVQDEKVDNPEYGGWAKLKAGAWVKFKFVNDMGQMKVEGEMTTKLKELTAEKAVIETVMVMDMGGQKREMKQPPRTVPVKVAKGTDSEGSKVEITAEGDEELEVNGKKLKCHWLQMKVTAKQGVFNTKQWRCGEVVGGSVKMEMNSEKPKMAMTMTAVEWKEEDK